MTNTATHQQLSFLQEKIHQIGSAIFFNLSDSVLKLPTSIVTTLKVDDYGFVWFLMQRPRQQLKEFEQEFPVRMDFFRKGSSCFLQVNGKGWVVTDPEEMNRFESPTGSSPLMAESDTVLVKVKIIKAEYYETKTTRHSWWQQAVSTVSTWFRHSNNSGYRPDIYYPAS